MHGHSSIHLRFPPGSSSPTLSGHGPTQAPVVELGGSRRGCATKVISFHFIGIDGQISQLRDG